LYPTVKNLDIGPFCFEKKVWLSPYFHHMVGMPAVAYSVIMKDVVTIYISEHIYVWAVSGQL
jgi:hypothetical protein